MFVRIVNWVFTKKTFLFLENFESIKERIRCAPGNLLELYQDKENKSIFFTYSYWDTEEDLENYRNSEFSMKFGLKKLFNGKPEAWSVDKFFFILMFFSWT
jgi:heme-degrading monooxygenase HmoA